MGGGGDIVMPQQQSYGESLAEALKAQAEFLQGTGAFAETGSLESLLPLEESVRKKTAQTDTDVLRQTLLGNQTGEVSGTYDDQGRLVIGQTQKSAGQAPTLELKETSPRKYSGYTKAGTTPVYEVVDQRGKVYGTVGGLKFGGGSQKVPGPSEGGQMKAIQNSLNELQSRAVTEFERTPEGQGEGEVVPVYARDPEGNIITDTSKIGQTEVIPATRQGDGMVDLLGDRREIVDYQTRQATEADVAAGLASEVGESITEAVGTGRQAGFSDTGEFQGAAALAEDIAAGSTSRQRERDISDVERLSGRFKTIMDEFKPAAATGIQGAKALIEEQKDKLTSAEGTITIPEGDTFGGEVGAGTVADPNTLSASTQFSGDAALGLGAGGEDTLRSALLADARGALSDGLTDREKARISEAFKGQSTMMGRTFDQSAGIAEAQARTLEDRNRQMQNRAFAQSALGQESGLQQGDLARGMGQELDQANLQQRTDLAQADIDTRQGIIEQGQRQQANQFNIGAQMDAERLNEELRQRGLANYIGAVGNLAAIEDQYTLDPFAAILGRGGGGSLQAGQGVFSQAGYGLQSGPQYLAPETGLGYISQMAANDANMFAANQAAQGAKTSGLFQGLGSLGAGLLTYCWVAREVYGIENPAWLRFRMWMFSKSPNWFFKLYGEYGERFASWISDKPRIKSFIRKWMDSKIKE